MYGGGMLKIILLSIVLSVHSITLLNGNLFSVFSQFNEQNRLMLQKAFDNFYVVQEGVFYRSQQLDQDTLGFYIQKYGIKTLINLRGVGKHGEWEKERQAAQLCGATCYLFGMSAIFLTNKWHLREMLTLFQTAERPLLVHCIGGADRTGEVSALWVLDQMGGSKEEALEQLSITYGHRKYKNSAKDFLIEIWQGRTWAMNDYDHRHYPHYCRPQDL